MRIDVEEALPVTSIAWHVAGECGVLLRPEVVGEADRLVTEWTEQLAALVVNLVDLAEGDAGK